MRTSRVSTMPTFSVILIKPTHYDDDGYPILWLRSMIPSNSLAAMYGIAEDCAKRQVLGAGVSISIKTYDETNTRIRPKAIASAAMAQGGKALICLVGVQSNQFPRAVDLARGFRALGLPVIIGGFHVSGILSMLPDVTPEIQSALDMGVSIYAGEAEDRRFDQVLRDGWNNELKPVYNFMPELPALNGAPVPHLPASELKSNVGHRSSFDLGRGCPFKCSFCTIINVQGRKSRFRTCDDLRRILIDNHAQGIRQFFITDDNFARNSEWEAFLDTIIDLRENHKIPVSLIIQVDTQCHKIPNFIEKCARAGVRRAFIGLENINPDNLVAAKKRQNKITDYRIMLQKWRNAGVYTWAGYIIGFPADTKATVLRDIEIIKRELPLDLLEIFFLTPLPGSEDHANMVRRGEWMDPDLNKYNLHHRVSHHPRMSDAEWEEAYDLAWRTYYSWEHIETVGRRRAALGRRGRNKAVQFLTEFKAIYEIEKIHPLEGGILRLKYRRDRRPELPIELPLVFHARLLLENAAKSLRYLGFAARGFWIRTKIESSRQKSLYQDQAISSVTDDDLDTLAMFKSTYGGAEAAAVKRKVEQSRVPVAARTSLVGGDDSLQ